VRRCARLQRAVERVRQSPRRCDGSPQMRSIEPRWRASAKSWPSWRRTTHSAVVRGEIFRLSPPRKARGHEQRGARYAVVVQADEFLGLSTVLVSPTSTAARPASFRPPIELEDAPTRVLVEQTTVVDPSRLGPLAGRLDANELQAIDQALALLFGL
jgi:mRNA interferase MazF